MFNADQESQALLQRVRATASVARVNVPILVEGSGKNGGSGHSATGTVDGSDDQNFALLKLEFSSPCSRVKSSWIVQNLLDASISLYEEHSTRRVGVLIDGTIKPIDQFSLEGRKSALLLAVGPKARQQLAAVIISLEFFNPLGYDDDDWSLDPSEIWNMLTKTQRYEDRAALFINTKTAAGICDVTTSAVRQWLKKEEIPYVMTGKRYRIYRAGLVKKKITGN